MSDTNHKYITVNDLPNADTVLPNDLIFVSRRDPTTNAIMSYHTDLYNIKRNISAQVANYVDEYLHTPFKNTYNLNFSKLKTEWKNVSVDLSCLSANLSSEWKQLETNMCQLSNNMMALSANICSEISTFCICAELSAEKQWRICAEYFANLEQDLYAKIQQLSTTIATNYVSVYNNQTIYGQKTFKEDIIGTALSAKWI